MVSPTLQEVHVSAIDALQQLAISPAGFVFDPRTGATFQVNATGRTILEGIRDGLGLDGLMDAISHSFDATAADLRRDVLEYVRLLRENSLLPRSFELE